MDEFDITEELRESEALLDFETKPVSEDEILTAGPGGRLRRFLRRVGLAVLRFFHLYTEKQHNQVCETIRALDETRIGAFEDSIRKHRERIIEARALIVQLRTINGVLEEKLRHDNERILELEKENLAIDELHQLVGTKNESIESLRNEIYKLEEMLQDLTHEHVMLKASIVSKDSSEPSSKGSSPE